MNELGALSESECISLYKEGQRALAEGRANDAVVCFGRVLSHSNSPELLKNLGNALLTIGNTSTCRAAYDRALQIDPKHLGALNNLALFERRSKNLLAAENLLRQAVAIAPQDSEVLVNLGIVLYEQGNFDEAESVLQKSVAMNGYDAQAWLGLAATQDARGFQNTVTNTLTDALARIPENKSVRLWLGRLLRKQGRFTEARDILHTGLAFAEGDPRQLSDIGSTFMGCGDIDQAIHCFARAIELKPDHVDALVNIAIAYNQIGRISEARTSAIEACRIEPDTAENWMTLASTYLAAGESEEASRIQRKALRIKPEANSLHSNVLHTLHYLDAIPTDELLQAHKNYGYAIERFSKPIHDNNTDQHRRLNIGYVSGDFCDHSVGCFFEPLIANHNSELFSIHLFATHWRQDETTARIRQHAECWHECWALEDEAFVRLIKECKIDILIDLSGHTAMNRLPVFARRPAPLQASWLGYPGTTGLKTIDLNLSDNHLDPADDTTPPYTERVVRIPHFCCYRPPSAPVPIGPLPLVNNGFATFGAFHSLAKLSPATLRLWAELLVANPRSRIKIIAKGARDARERTINTFAAFGVSVDRVQISNAVSFEEYLIAHNSIDLFVDAFPWNGHTTTCHALWMGIPTLTLRGKRRSGRMGLALQAPMGLTEFIAESESDFILKGTSAIKEPNLLASLRKTLRNDFLASSLTDGPRFAASIESVYQQEWQKWCQDQQGNRINLDHN